MPRSFLIHKPQPTRNQGFARTANESVHPELWKGLKGAWSSGLGHTGATLFDASDNGGNGTLTSMDSATDWVIDDGRYVLDFDGSNDHILVGRPPSIDGIIFPFTISVWVKPTGSFIDFRNIVFKGDSAGQFGIIVASTGVWECQFTTSSNVVGGTLVLDEWFHIAYTLDDPGLAITYQNGLLQNSGTSRSNSAKTEDFTIGADTSNSRFFEGRIDDCFIYDRVLNAAEISKLYTLGRGGIFEKKSGFFFKSISPTNIQLTGAKGETLGFNDPTLNNINRTNLPPETFAFNEAITILAGFLIRVFETLGFTDNLQRNVANLRLVTDTLGTNDAVQRKVNVFRLLVDTLGTSDNLERTVTNLRLVADTLGLSDNVERIVESLRSISDTLGTSDDVKRKVTVLRIIADILGFTDVYNIDTDEPTGENEIIVSEVLGMLDDLERQSDASRLIDDTLGITDDINRMVDSFRLISDTLGTNDALIRELQYFRLITDTLGTSDNLERTANLLRVISDTLGFNDNLQKTTEFARVVSDILGMSDNVERNAEILRIINDILGMSDNYAGHGAMLLFRQVSDIMGINDNVERQATFFRLISDIIGFNDNVDLTSTDIVVILQVLELIAAINRTVEFTLER